MTRRRVRPVNPAGQLSAAELAALGDAAAAQSRLAGGPNLVVRRSAGGGTFTRPPDGRLPAKLTAVTGTAYSWTKQIEDPATPGGWIDDPEGFAGTASVLPAYEVTGRPEVPLGTVVRLRPGLGDYYLFEECNCACSCGVLIYAKNAPAGDYADLATFYADLLDGLGLDGSYLVTYVPPGGSLPSPFSLNFYSLIFLIQNSSVDAALSASAVNAWLLAATADCRRVLVLCGGPNDGGTMSGRNGNVNTYAAAFSIAVNALALSTTLNADTTDDLFKKTTHYSGSFASKAIYNLASLAVSDDPARVTPSTPELLAGQYLSEAATGSAAATWNGDDYRGTCGYSGNMAWLEAVAGTNWRAYLSGTATVLDAVNNAAFLNRLHPCWLAANTCAFAVERRVLTASDLSNLPSDLNVSADNFAFNCADTAAGFTDFLAFLAAYGPTAITIPTTSTTSTGRTWSGSETRAAPASDPCLGSGSNPVVVVSAEVYVGLDGCVTAGWFVQLQYDGPVVFTSAGLGGASSASTTGFSATFNPDAVSYFPSMGVNWPDMAGAFGCGTPPTWPFYAKLNVTQ